MERKTFTIIKDEYIKQEKDRFNIEKKNYIEKIKKYKEKEGIKKEVWTSSKLEKLVKDWRKDAVNDFEDNYEQVVPDLADSFLYQYGNSLRDYFNKIGLTSRSAQKEYISDLLV